MDFQKQERNLETLLEDQLLQTIKYIFHALSSKKDLSPNENTSAQFLYLGRLALSNNANHREVVDSLQKDGTLQSLIELCCKGEIELERYWASRIIRREKDITQFPYYGNYVQLTKFELEQIQQYIGLDGKKLLFVGSGALPLTAIMFKQQQPSLEIRCIDKDAKFVKLCRELLSKLRISYLPIGNFDINDLNPDVQSMLSSTSIVFIAALVGNSNSEKNQILYGIHPYLTRGSLVGIRSVPDDMRRLFYPKF